ncbi:Nicastrin-like protein [Dinothrombium tinctorium]|uniref:Nicastrin n=1 Tax=Dinothrombium tinctorium TaxID=1965070 RepID=A0A3S3NMT4_9ACAR|nr:Nicastrin-like protein [Dinothrombium tinctorium]RWS06147.1 Nicastrin-like protein [Dinothrombium tinctorium]
MYQNIESDFYCISRLNATHSIGCQTNYGGNVGVVFVVENDDDLEWVLRKGKSAPYIPALYISHFTKDILLKLRDSGRISGAILLNRKQSARPEGGFSPDNTCPNYGFGLYTNKYANYAYCPANEWNPKNPATNLMYIDWRIPIYLLTDEASIRNLTKCFNDFNKPINGSERNWPLCAVQLNSRMNAAVNTPTCMRRNNLPFIPLSNPILFCDPISSYNIIATLFPTSDNVTVNNRSVIVVATRLDSFSLFVNKAMGAYSVITSVITLLSVAHTLAQNVAKLSKTDKNVLFAFFDGENWDYIGSSRTAYDMKRKNFKPIDHFTSNYRPAKLGLEHISHFIELSQIAPFESSNTLWIHRDPISNQYAYVNKTVTDLIQLIKKKSSNSIHVNKSDAQSPLPPASFQSFLKEDLNISGIVLSNYEKQYTNKYFNSFLDFENRTNNETIKFLANITSLVANTIISLVNDQEFDVKANETISFTFLWMANKKNKENGSCICSSCFLTEALSPAFLDDSVDWESTSYSTWTESVWRMSAARLFLKPSLTQESSTLFAGLVIFLLSFIIIYILRERLPLILQTNGDMIYENNVSFQNHISREIQHYDVSGTEVTFSNPNRKDIVTTQL